jgi:dienelactone hydrolase
MVITTEFFDIPAGGAPMRMFVAAPKSPGKYPGIVCYSDIFQLTGPMLRLKRPWRISMRTGAPRWTIWPGIRW